MIPSKMKAVIFEKYGDPDVLHPAETGDVAVAPRILAARISDIQMSSPRVVSFPKPSGGMPDPNFADKLVVTQYNSRHVYRQPGQRGKDIQYGDVLEAKGTVSIIAINTTITLMKADGTTINVIGPLTFRARDC